MATPRRRYIEHRENARKRNIAFLLTFDEWWDLWQQSGKWDQRGNRRGKYCMARFGDRGAYEIGNVSICPIETNRSERNENYPLQGSNNPAYGRDYWASASIEERERRAANISKQFKGKTQSPAQITARMESTAKTVALRWLMAHLDDPDVLEILSRRTKR